MKKIVTVEIDCEYAGVLTLTAIGTSVWQTKVSTTAVDLSKCCHISLGEDGKWIQHPTKDGEDDE